VQYFNRSFYSAPISQFVNSDASLVLGVLTDNSGFSIETTQRDAWRSQIQILQPALKAFEGRGTVFFEFIVPRLGKRIDVLALIDHAILSSSSRSVNRSLTVRRWIKFGTTRSTSKTSTKPAITA